MYLESGIEKLSPTQVSKLLNGHGVRVKHGSHHKVHLSSEQHKKLHRAHAKGKASTITFDPFQIQSHQHLREHSKHHSKHHLKGGTTAKDWLSNQYNQIPEAYHPGIESLAHAGLSQAGFGLKKRGRPRKHHAKGGNVFDDIKNAFTDRNVWEKQVPRALIDYGIPYAVGSEFGPLGSFAASQFTPMIKRQAGLGLRKKKTHGGSLLGSTAKHLLKPMAKQVARQVVKRGASFAGPAAAAAAMAMGQPELAPLAALAGDAMAREGAHRVDSYIQGLGMHKRRGRPRKHHGKQHAGALFPAGMTY